jgi:hypothetical protein
MILLKKIFGFTLTLSAILLALTDQFFSPINNSKLESYGNWVVLIAVIVNFLILLISVRVIVQNRIEPFLSIKLVVKNEKRFVFIFLFSLLYLLVWHARIRESPFLFSYILLVMLNSFLFLLSTKSSSR